METADGEGITGIVERNITALLERRKAEEKKRRLEIRVADAITRFTGSMRFVYIHAVVFGLWVVGNLGWIPYFPVFDPSFVVLAMAASVEAIFLSTFILISQNRMAELSEERNELNLQISLLAEHEVTRLIHLVSAIAARLELEEGSAGDLAELKRDVRPETVLEGIEEVKRGLEER